MNGPAKPALPDVVIPVHNAFDYVRNCLGSLGRTTPGARVIVVDDASTDPRVRPLLKEWCDRGERRELVPLDRNRGFVAAANLGAARSQRDVVLLNSDTEVTPGWLEALARCLASAPDVATATPWTNNGEIVSLPRFCAVNPPPKDAGALADCLRRAGPPHYPELPTAVGFCMAVARRAMEQLGLFDVEAFGRGYGEENDFCLRAAAAGWRNLLCDDAFVVHHGGRSFAPLGLKPGAESMARLLARHPGYERMIGEWIARDPLRARRRELLAACYGEASVRISGDEERGCA